jgi:hypothetical protein
VFARSISLRQKFAAWPYPGIVIEINQKFPRGDARRLRALRAILVASLEEALGHQRRTVK